jgi:hypothetical protein
MRVLGIDPGKDNGGPDSASGWCYMDEKRIINSPDGLMWGSTKDLGKFLKEWSTEIFPVDQVVVEGYFINPRQQGRLYGNIGKGKMATPENVGKVKMWAELQGIPVHEFFNTDKVTEQNVTGMKYDKKTPKALTHRMDAFNHARYWLITVARIAPSYLEELMMKEGKL